MLADAPPPRRDRDATEWLLVSPAVRSPLSSMCPKCEVEVFCAEKDPGSLGCARDDTKKDDTRKEGTPIATKLPRWFEHCHYRAYRCVAVEEREPSSPERPAHIDDALGRTFG